MRGRWCLLLALDRLLCSFDSPRFGFCNGILGAKDAKLEIAVSNSLTVNLHLLMAAFYRPTKTRNVILIESAAFPSDRYATASQVIHHGYDPTESLVEITHAEGVHAHTENYGHANYKLQITNYKL